MMPIAAEGVTVLQIDVSCARVGNKGVCSKIGWHKASNNLSGILRSLTPDTKPIQGKMYLQSGFSLHVQKVLLTTHWKQSSLGDNKNKGWHLQFSRMNMFMAGVSFKSTCVWLKRGFWSSEVPHHSYFQIFWDTPPTLWICAAVRHAATVQSAHAVVTVAGCAEKNLGNTPLKFVPKAQTFWHCCPTWLWVRWVSASDTPRLSLVCRWRPLRPCNCKNTTWNTVWVQRSSGFVTAKYFCN